MQCALRLLFLSYLPSVEIDTRMLLNFTRALSIILKMLFIIIPPFTFVCFLLITVYPLLYEITIDFALHFVSFSLFSECNLKFTSYF